MSLARIAMRIAAVEALKGRTLVGDNVLDSEIGAFETRADGALRSSKDKPFLTVYTDAASVSGDTIQLRSLNQNGATEIVFEMGVTTAMTETNDDGESTIVGIPATDRTLEFFLDVVSREISEALTDPDNEWGQIFQSFAIKYQKIERLRTSNEDEGVRLAGQQIRVTASLVEDPVPGTQLATEGAFAKFFAAAAVSPDPMVQAHAALMQAKISGSQDAVANVTRRLGMLHPEMSALGFGDLTEDTPAGNALEVVAVESDLGPVEIRND